MDDDKTTHEPFAIDRVDETHPDKLALVTLAPRVSVFVTNAIDMARHAALAQNTTSALAVVILDMDRSAMTDAEFKSEVGDTVGLVLQSSKSLQADVKEAVERFKQLVDVYNDTTSEEPLLATGTYEEYDFDDTSDASAIWMSVDWAGRAQAEIEAIKHEDTTSDNGLRKILRSTRAILYYTSQALAETVSRAGTLGTLAHARLMESKAGASLSSVLAASGAHRPEDEPVTGNGQ